VIVQPGDLVLVRKTELPVHGKSYLEKDRYAYAIILEQPFIEKYSTGPYPEWEYKRVRVLVEGQVKTVSFNLIKKIEDDI